MSTRKYTAERLPVVVDVEIREQFVNGVGDLAGLLHEFAGALDDLDAEFLQKKRSQPHIQEAASRLLRSLREHVMEPQENPAAPKINVGLSPIYKFIPEKWSADPSWPGSSFLVLAEDVEREDDEDKPSASFDDFIGEYAMHTWGKADRFAHSMPALALALLYQGVSRVDRRPASQLRAALLMLTLLRGMGVDYYQVRQGGMAHRFFKTAMDAGYMRSSPWIEKQPIRAFRNIATSGKMVEQVKHRNYREPEKMVDYFSLTIDDIDLIESELYKTGIVLREVYDMAEELMSRFPDEVQKLRVESEDVEASLRPRVGVAPVGS